MARGVDSGRSTGGLDAGRPGIWAARAREAGTGDGGPGSAAYGGGGRRRVGGQAWRWRRAVAAGDGGG
ncbi:hypothetical protein, partial [Saccharothrix carnea]|uniref:hypothetical protein n=1 Tax=Saccharothrix carnea TaxID=1280637 RepID=UPI001C633F37